MKKLRLLAILFAGSLLFTSCMQDETMDEILNDTDLEQIATDPDEPNPPTPPPPGGN